MGGSPQNPRGAEARAAGSDAEWGVVIPTRNTRTLTSRCLASLEALRDVRVVVVDDGSEDGTAAEIERRFPGVEILRFEENVGFTRAANAGVARIARPCILLLNSDTELPGESWRGLRGAFARRPGLGVAGAQLVFPSGEPQWSGGSEPGPTWLFALASGFPRALRALPAYRAVRASLRRGGAEVEWVSGAAMAFRRVVWQSVGPFDEGYGFYGQDLDLCLSARRAGWEVAILPEFRVVHHLGATIGQSGGAAGRQNPELLWTDLARWALKQRGERGARAALRALRWGGRLRLLARKLGEPFQGGDSREAWKRETRGYRRALTALEEYGAGDDRDEPEVPLLQRPPEKP